MKLSYSELKSYSRQLLGVEFPWEASLPANATDDDKAMLVLLWNAFIDEVNTAPEIPDNLRMYK